MSESDIKYIRESRLRHSVIDREDITVLLYAKIRSRKSPGWAKLYDDYLDLKPKVGGLDRKDAIKMMEVLMRYERE